MGGPVCWGCTREKGTVSRSSCESKIYATDEGTKSVLTVHHLLQDLGSLIVLSLLPFGMTIKDA
jgi:hypothetical protein